MTRSYVGVCPLELLLCEFVEFVKTQLYARSLNKVNYNLIEH